MVKARFMPWALLALAAACGKSDDALGGRGAVVDERDAGHERSDANARSDAGAKREPEAEPEPETAQREKPARTVEKMPESKPATTQEAAEDKTRVRIPFLASVNEEPLKCGARYENVGTARSSFELSDFRFYVYDVAFIDQEGRVTPVKLDDDVDFQLRYTKQDGSEGGLAMLDFATLDSDACSRRGTQSTNTLISGHAPEGDYSKLTFTLGVPPELNHVNGALSQAPLNSYGMQWSWASGYRYMKLEVEPTTGDKTKEVWYFHPGAAGCTADDGAISGKYKCDSPMTSRIELPYARDKQAVQADLARLFASSDLSKGRGCMGTSTLADPEVDGAEVQPTTGCAEVWSTLGLKPSQALTNVAEKLGTCDGGASCKSDAECSGGVTCTGYIAEKKAEPPESVPQTTFASIAYDLEQAPKAGERPALEHLQDDMPFGWPHPDYERDPELEVPALSLRNGKDSHPPDDARYGANCMTCHQEAGPGKGRYAVAGTIFDPKGGVYAGGGAVQFGTGVANRRGPWTHPVADKIRDFEALFEVPIDAYGQFYATPDQAEGLDYSKRNYFARVVADSGTCKSTSGKVIHDASGAAVSCKADADCGELRYSEPGQCTAADGTTMMEASGAPRSCATAQECGQAGASCSGASSDRVAACDKLLNAMPLEAVGSCNFCHGQGFRIHTEPTL
jgi:uncharacterized repeat protein (TIGR04052 family)